MTAMMTTRLPLAVAAVLLLLLALPLPTHTTTTTLPRTADAADTLPKWNLAGVHLHAAQDHTTAPRIRWRAPPRLFGGAAAVSSPPPTPSLLYSLFAEYHQDHHDRTPHAAGEDAGPVVPMRLVWSSALPPAGACAGAGEGECAVDVGHLPRGVPITFVLLVQCAAEERGNGNATPTEAPAATQSDNIDCTPALSSVLRVTLPPAAAEAAIERATAHPTSATKRMNDANRGASPPPSPMPAAVGIDRVANDTEVRADLALFYDLTGGPTWLVNASTSHWLSPDVSLCDWDGIGCDATRTSIVEFNFVQFGLGVIPMTPIDIQVLFAHISTLEKLDLSHNPFFCLQQLDLTSQTLLTDLGSRNLGLACPLDWTIPCRLPAVSLLQSLSLHSGSSVEIVSGGTHFPRLADLVVTDTRTAFPLVLILAMPALERLQISGSNIDTTTPDAGGYTGGALVHRWLGALDTYNPALDELTIVGPTSLDFDRTPREESNWPLIVSGSLSSLQLMSLPQLRTTSPPPSWLTSLPSLSFLVCDDLVDVTIQLSAFVDSTSLVTLQISYTQLSGDLSALSQSSLLASLMLASTGLSSTLPSEIAQLWPRLAQFIIKDAALHGSVPSFRDLPLLWTLDLGRNLLTGSLPTDFLSGSIEVLTIDLSQNQLTGAIPNFQGHDVALTSLALNDNLFSHQSFDSRQSFPRLTSLALQSNRITGSLPDHFWSVRPSLQRLYLARNDFWSTIPDAPQLRSLTAIDLSNNFFYGALPVNVTASVFDVSYTRMSGPVRVAEGVTQLNLAFTKLSCPIDLETNTQLISLDLRNANFSGCDFTTDDVRLPLGSLKQILISHNAWAPFTLSLWPNLRLVEAINASVIALAIPSVDKYQLESLDLSYSNLALEKQHDLFSTTLLKLSSLTSFACASCSLASRLEDVLRSFAFTTVLSDVNLEQNRLHGHWPIQTFASLSMYDRILPLSIRQLSVAGNPGITGVLPTASTSYSKLLTIDVSGTGVSGSLPDSWSALLGLQRLSVQNTTVACNMRPDGFGGLRCDMPLWVTKSSDLAPSALTIGAHCPTMRIANDATTVVIMDESYYRQTLCTCDSKYFGKDGVCVLCPVGCTCEGDVITDCFPIVRSAMLASDLSPAVTLEISAILQCPRTTSGSSMCNPQGHSWSNFYRIAGQKLDLTTFCSAGHTDRVCSRCMRGHFASGRSCPQCAAKSLHVLIILAYIGLFVALCVFTYARLPSTATSVTAMRAYLGDSSVLPRSETVANASDAAPAPSPLKLLVFHCQQLGLLLSATSAQPAALTGLLSVLSSSSTGFSFASLLAVECLTSAWGLVQQCWVGLLAPALVFVAAAAVFVAQRRRNPTATAGRRTSSAAPSLKSHRSSDLYSNLAPEAVQLRSSDAELTTESDVAIGVAESTASTPSRTPRLYGACLALLYFFVFPCAQTALSAVACTDSRQYGGAHSALYLNLHPWVECDSTWAYTVLPPALLGILLWFFAFPVSTTLLVRALHRRLSSATVTPDPTVWPLCSDLLTPYRRRYWYYEQVLLLRRLTLVACVTLIPSESLYLPLALFAVIQASALLQHVAAPYAHLWLNRAELASLYLLLLNYITALVLHQTTCGAVDAWAVVLFLLNFVFVLVLVAGLFAALRPALPRLWTILCAWAERLAHSLGISTNTNAPAAAKDDPDQARACPGGAHSYSYSSTGPAATGADAECAPTRHAGSIGTGAPTSLGYRAVPMRVTNFSLRESLLDEADQQQASL